MENNTHELRDQLLDYYAGAKAASGAYFDKSEKIDNFGFQGTENLSPEGVGGFVAMGGLVGKLAYAGARLVETTCNVPQSFSDVLNTAALPFNAVAGIAIAAGAYIMAGNAIKELISRRVGEKGTFLSEQASYAMSGYHALKNGSLSVPEGSTVEDVLVAIRERGVSEYLEQGGDPQEVEYFYPEVDMEYAGKLIAKVENAKSIEDTKKQTLAELDRIDSAMVAVE